MKELGLLFTFFFSMITSAITAGGVWLIGYVVFDTLNRGFIGISLLILFVLLGLYAAYHVFHLIQGRGVIDFMTVNNKTPNLDDLVLGADSDVRKLTLTEYHELIKSQDVMFRGGYIRIWGDWEGRELKQIHSIHSATVRDNELQFKFRNGHRLTIFNPDFIYESRSFIKIMKASEVKWEWKASKRYFQWKHIDKTIEVKTNSNWVTSEYDTISGYPAVFIYNQL